MQPETETIADDYTSIPTFTETIAEDIGTVTPVDETPAAETVGGGQIPLAGGSGVAIRMVQSAVAEELARAEEGVLSYGYDQERAWLEIADLNRRVVEAKEEWEDDKKTAAASKKAHDELVETLTERIAALESERRKPRLALSGVEPMATTVRTEGGDAPVGCDYERRTGLPCAICRGQVLPDVSVPEDAKAADAPTHHAVAEQFSLQRLSALLATKDAHIEWQALNGLEPAQLRALADWCGIEDGVPPQLLAQRAHLAGGVDDNGEQRCMLCQGVLTSGSEQPYIFHSFVGLDCEAAQIKTPQPPSGDGPDATEPEPARVLPMRGTKNRRKKANPEAEAALQSQAAVAVPDEAGDDAGAE
jgi:hypothetical protein